MYEEPADGRIAETSIHDPAEGARSFLNSRTRIRLGPIAIMQYRETMALGQGRRRRNEDMSMINDIPTSLLLITLLTGNASAAAGNICADAKCAS
ncbi:MAG: hypothetical protein QF781_10230 [Phycisphaerales bacterium]|nr:hypothetical protein [Phycisphaerales bacterium]MDP6312513.1 hypothetical protein [Phycisphaerales bacterium]MDP7087550.1 hypothetical protein [Phycisphaerales bacterium]MDP7190192.1 hypothetical protein [Phycisphaerales bacterium]MDP7520139.1 hypothetical protein [Phycisphaerales bacterium]